MSTASRPYRQGRGFTLLEVMLAVVLLSLVITAVYATWSAALRGWKRSSGMTETFQRERVVLNSLAELMQSVVFYRTDAGLYDLRGVANELTNASISFVTASDVLLPATETLAGGMRRVTLTMERDENQHSYLAIRNQAALVLETTSADEMPPHILSADVSGFAIRYRHPQSGEWVDKWEEKSLVPSTVEFTVTFGGADPQIPAVVATRVVGLPTASYVAQTGGAGPAELLTPKAPRTSQGGGRTQPTGIMRLGE